MSIIVVHLAACDPASNRAKLVSKSRVSSDRRLEEIDAALLYTAVQTPRFFGDGRSYVDDDSSGFCRGQHLVLECRYAARIDIKYCDPIPVPKQSRGDPAAHSTKADNSNHIFPVYDA